jgi:carbonic anhydrase
MRCCRWLPILFLTTALPSQHPGDSHPSAKAATPPAQAKSQETTQAPAQATPKIASPSQESAETERPQGVAQAGGPTPPVYQTHLQLPPVAALDHIRTGLARAQAARAKGMPIPAPLTRPSGAGRYIAAVLVCADADLDVPSLFGVLPKDLLVFRVPGAFASAEITALIEQAVANEKLSLCIVLTHTQCRSLEPDQGSSTAATALARRGEPARTVAQTRQLALPMAQAFVEREHLLSLSESLRAATAKDQLRIVAATADTKTQAITWHTTRVDELPIAPVK